MGEVMERVLTATVRRADSGWAVTVHARTLDDVGCLLKRIDWNMPRGNGATPSNNGHVDMQRRLKTAIDEAGGVRALSRKRGVSAAHISNLRLGKRGAGKRVLAKIGLARTIHMTTRYQEAGKGDRR